MRDRDTMNGWTSDRIDELKAHLAAGHSYGLSAKKMGLSRSAVLAKAKRLRDAGDTAIAITAPWKQVKGATERVTKPAIQRVPRVRKTKPVDEEKITRGGFMKLVSRGRVFNRATSWAPIDPPARVVADLPPSREVSMLDIRSGECWWPTSEPEPGAHRFCGARTTAGSFCAGHRQMAYTGKPRPTVRVADESPRPERDVNFLPEAV